MRKYVAITLIFSLIAIGCTRETNKNSRQFENTIEATVLSKDLKEIESRFRSFYVFESTVENLFDEKGYFIHENEQFQRIPTAIVRSGARDFFKQYNMDTILLIDKTIIEKEVLEIITSFNMNIGTEEFKIRFNAVFLDNLNAKK